MITKDRCVFKILNSKQTAIKIYQEIEQNAVRGDKNNKCNANKVFINNKNLCKKDFKSLVHVVEEEYVRSKQKLDLVCSKLNIKWLDYQEEYLMALQNELGIQVDGEVFNGLSCYVNDFLNNEIEFSDNTIFLNANIAVDKIFSNFIIMLTKLTILNWWKVFNNWNWGYTYKENNKIWLFIEIAIDAIFSKTSLSKITCSPSYKYFYDTTINGICFMDRFRTLYEKISLKDFLNMVFMFVVQNYKTLTKFKNYLH